MKYASQPPSQGKMTVGFNIGIVAGIGIDATYQVAPNWHVRAAVNVSDILINNYQYKFKLKGSDVLAATPQTLSFDLAVRFSHLNLGIDRALDIKNRFRLLAGVNIYPKNFLSFGGELASIIKLNDVKLNGNDLGSGSIKMGFKSPISPYLGLGIVFFQPHKRVNVSFNTKIIYKGDYKFNIFVKDGLIAKMKKLKKMQLFEIKIIIMPNGTDKFWPKCSCSTYCFTKYKITVHSPIRNVKNKY
ncbi:MAG: hypothetical protein U5L45_01350 [Saprospiraceae bacterium]|nr:hypothetical protein [Saprospiraceae bacterium]